MTMVEAEPQKKSWPVYPPEDLDASHFNWVEYLRQFPAEAIERGAGRRNLTRYNPLLFALIYFRHHLKDESEVVSFSDFHLESCRVALNWARPITKKRQYRDCIVAPRAAGKSTWWFLILPMWAAAHGHVKFLAAFSDSATQAERHLDNFRKELDNNAMLRLDFKELADPATRRGTKHQVAVNSQMLQTASGFVFTANGIDSSTLGLKIENRRPDLIVLDDIEPGESSYSLHQMDKRLSTIQDVVLPLNDNARVVITGTVTMNGSIIHQLVKTVTDPEEPSASWIAEENFKVRYSRPIVDTEEGSRRSVWPYKWSLDYLQSIEHTRSYAKNFANKPVGADGSYWSENHFSIGTAERYGLTYLSLDPAVTSKGTSDYSAFAVVSYVPPSFNRAEFNRMLAQTEDGALIGTAYVRHVDHKRIEPGAPMRQHVLDILTEYPEIKAVYVETNQGGDVWNSIFHDLPVELRTVHQSVSKDVRAARLVAEYEAEKIKHTRHFIDAEQEMISYPNGSHDDTVDAIGTGIHLFRQYEAENRYKIRPTAKQRTADWA